MIDRSVNNFDETHDKLGLNDFDESHDTNDTLDIKPLYPSIFCSLYPSIFCSATSVSAQIPELVERVHRSDRLPYSLPSHSSIVPRVAARYRSND